jgi:hypothetical protein
MFQTDEFADLLERRLAAERDPMTKQALKSAIHAARLGAKRPAAPR